MLKNRVGVMKIDTRKTFIAVIITGLIERTNDAKLMKALCKVRPRGSLVLKIVHTKREYRLNFFFFPNSS